MANLNELRKYLTHTFSTGSATGKDYKTFQTKYINYLRSLCKLHRWELVNVGRNHYCFAAFIRNEQSKLKAFPIRGRQGGYPFSAESNNCATVTS